MGKPEYKLSTKTDTFIWRVRKRETEHSNYGAYKDMTIRRRGSFLWRKGEKLYTPFLERIGRRIWNTVKLRKTLWKITYRDRLRSRAGVRYGQVDSLYPQRKTHLAECNRRDLSLTNTNNGFPPQNVDGTYALISASNRKLFMEDIRFKL